MSFPVLLCKIQCIITWGGRHNGLPPIPALFWIATVLHLFLKRPPGGNSAFAVDAVSFRNPKGTHPDQDISQWLGRKRACIPPNRRWCHDRKIGKPFYSPHNPPIAPESVCTNPRIPATILRLFYSLRSWWLPCRVATSPSPATAKICKKLLFLHSFRVRGSNVPEEQLFTKSSEQISESPSIHLRKNKLFQKWSLSIQEMDRWQKYLQNSPRPMTSADKRIGSRDFSSIAWGIMSVYYMTWGCGVYPILYNFQKAEYFDNKRNKVLNSKLTFSCFLFWCRVRRKQAFDARVDSWMCVKQTTY